MESVSNKQLAVTSKITSQKYHDIFDFKLTKEELVKWKYKNIKETTTGRKNKTRLQREKFSKRKMSFAKKVSNILGRIPPVKFIGITGALAMMNAGKESDIDLMIITKNGRLWTTRLICYFVTLLLGFKTRRPKSKFEKDRLCLNMWLDESDLVWNKKDRNIYTAHEIAQVIPLVNKDKTYEKFLNSNKWILDYWPNSVKIASKATETLSSSQSGFIERILFRLQYLYMKPKITREVVTKTRAIFHPNNWGKQVQDKLTS